MTKKSNILSLLPIDADQSNLRAAVDVYAKTKSILEATNIALGRTFDINSTNQSSTDIYITPTYEHPSTY